MNITDESGNNLTDEAGNRLVTESAPIPPPAFSIPLLCPSEG